MKTKILFFCFSFLIVTALAACGSPLTTTKSQTSVTPTGITATSSSMTIAPTSTTEQAVKPQGELVAALQGFGNENFLPWLDAKFASAQLLVYEMLIYWDHINFKFLPGLAESWEVSPDGLTLTYHLRKGVQFSDGWGELTSDDVKYTFEMHASPKSIGKTAQCRRIASMDTPDPNTLIVHFKDSYPTFYVDLAMANSGVCQGIVCKKYCESVGEEQASEKPIGTGPYKLVESKLGDYYKFEAFDSHWRIVPEFKTIKVRLISEVGTYVAALKNKEIDLTEVSANQVMDLKAAGVAVEVNPIGGNSVFVCPGGMVASADKRYDAAYHNKDPWADSRVRKAMAIAIDREALCKAIYNDFADPASVPLITKDFAKYQYPYDPTAAKQLLKDAGYPNGFSFRAISCNVANIPEAQRIMEALCGYWQQIGLDPKITVIDYNTYYTKSVNTCKTAGDVFLNPISAIADMLSRVELSLMPNVVMSYYQDEGSYAIYNQNAKSSFEERNALVDKLNKYYFDNVGPIPVVRSSRCFAWNSDKILPWPHVESAQPLYLEYVRHAKALNTFRLFSPWPDR